MGLYKVFIVLLLSCLINNQGWSQNLCATNPSFEGPSQAHVVPAPWTNCGGTPDTQPGQWGITLPPSDGSSYVSFLQAGSSSGGYYEGASQVLSACMVAGQTYTISMDLAHSNIYNTAGPGNCYSSFAIYGGNSNCDEQELLGQVGPIMNTNWQTFTFTWTATGNWCYITFRPIWITTCSGYINILVDNFGCVTVVGGAVATTDASCFDVCDGTAIVTPIAGTPPYTFLWSNGSVSSTITGLCDGVYDVTITDGTGATDTQSGTVAEPTALVGPVTVTNVSCLSGSNGTASVAASGGTTAYTYAWSGGGNGTSVSGLTAGNYNVSVTDANGCLLVTPFTILDGGIVTASISATTDVSCFGGTDGTAILLISDGLPPYTIMWCNGQTNTTVTSLPAGNCIATITDASGCSTTATATINQPTVLGVTISASTPVTCFGVCDGTATAAPTGGTTPYTYAWSGGPTTVIGTGLCAGTETIDITDSLGCTATASVVITEPTVLALNTTFINPGCMDSCDGSATVAASGGSPPYTYSWNDPGGQTTTTASGLCDGAYVITVQDSNACIAVATAVLVDPPFFVAAITSSTNVDCFSNCNGSAVVGVSGGGLPYTYLWSSGDTSNQAVALCQGTYSVTVYNINGCRSVANVTITEPPVLDVTIIGTNVSCFGACNGVAAATATGGATGYTYLWDDPIFQSTATAINLCSSPGGITYTVLVTDSNGCTTTDSELITQPTQLGLLQNIVQPTTCSSNNGSACVNGFGGITPYTYVWNNVPATTDSCLTAVFAGGFDVSVTDAMGCVFNMAVLITDIAGPVIDSVTAPPLLCFGDNNGTASVAFSGGTSPFTYTWYDGVGAVISTGSSVIFNQVADDYSIVIEDGNQCIAADTLSIVQPPQLASAIFPYTDAACAGVCDGTATVVVNGGTPGYTYAWTSGGSSSTETGLCFGTANVFVLDANSCGVQSAQIISEPSPLTLTYLANDVACNGDSTGDIYLTVGGGTGVYTYDWIQGGQTGSFLIDLPIGTYDVDVRDAQGCLISASIVINEPPVLLAIASTDASKCGNADGTATVVPTGGTQPWNYVWNPGGFQTTAVATGLLAGNYSVTVTDMRNCTFELTGITVNDIPGPTIDSVVMQDASCAGTATGTGIVYVTPNSGTPPLTYTWSSGQMTSSATGFAAGSVTVTVSDLYLCDVVGSATVYEPAPLIVNIIQDVQICFGASASLDASGSIGGVGTLTYDWGNIGTGPIQVINPFDDTTLTVVVTDANGCFADSTINVSVMDPLTMPTSAPVICDGNSTTVDVTASGGLGSGYSYIWSPNVSTTATAVVSPTIPGATYNVTVTDACSTPATISIVVAVNPTPVAIFLTDCDPDPFLVQFYGAASTVDAPGTISSYDWTFGDPLSGADDVGTGVVTSHDFTPGEGTPFFSVTLTVTSTPGNCTNSTTNSVAPPPIADFIVDPLESTSLNPNFDLTDNSTYLDPSSYFQWTFGDGTVAPLGNGPINNVFNTTGTYIQLSHNYLDTGIFYITLTVEEPNGCKDSIGKYVRIKAEYIMFAPNTFIPGSFITENQVFRPKIIGMGDDEFEIYIFDRWGDKVYEYIGNYNTWLGWDGIVNKGKKMAQKDVYVWLIRAEDLNQENHESIGHLTLIR